MKKSIIVGTENIGLILDRLQRALPKKKMVRTHYLYTRSLRTANQLMRTKRCVQDRNGEILSSTVLTNWHMETDMRPKDLALQDAYHGGIRGRYNNAWGPGDLLAMHTGRGSSSMHNFLRLKVGDRIKFVGTSKVFIETEHPISTRGKCIIAFERL